MRKDEAVALRRRKEPRHDEVTDAFQIYFVTILLHDDFSSAEEEPV